MKRLYKVVKNTLRDDHDNGRETVTIGFFPSKKSAEKFVQDENNVEMWKTEYKKVMAIITLEIGIETLVNGDIENFEIYWLFN